MPKKSLTADQKRQAAWNKINKTFTDFGAPVREPTWDISPQQWTAAKHLEKEAERPENTGKVIKFNRKDQENECSHSFVRFPDGRIAAIESDPQKQYFAEPGSFNRVKFAVSEAGDIWVYRPSHTEDTLATTNIIKNSYDRTNDPDNLQPPLKKSALLLPFSGMEMLDVCRKPGGVSAKDAIAMLDGICCDLWQSTR